MKKLWLIVIVLGLLLTGCDGERNKMINEAQRNTLAITATPVSP